MTQKDNSIALLPNGFVDLLPPFAQNEANSVRKLIDTFISFGYQRVKPPLLEFEDSLLAKGVGEHLSKDTFRVMDTLSHKMLGLRSDSTAQISRIVSSRLASEPRPLRLTYANEVLRTNGSQVRSERQFMQVGCEFIGSDNCFDSDVEICIIAILGLKSIGLGDITLDLTIPNFVSCLLPANHHNMSEILKAVAQRDVDALFAFGSDDTQILAKIMSNSGLASDVLPALLSLDLPNKLSANIDRLRHVCDNIEAALDDLSIDDVSIVIDVVDQNGSDYHNNFGFSLFSPNVSGELGSGGCYDVCFGQEEHLATAKGFTLYMDTIAKVASNNVDEKCIFVSADSSWSAITSLQDQGWITVRGSNGGAGVSSCTHIYKNGEIVEL